MDTQALIAQLGAVAVPDLARLDGAALARQARSEARETQVMTGLAVAGALLIGAASAAPQAAPAAAAVPFGAPPALTPLVQLAQR